MGIENAGDSAALDTKWSLLEEHYRDNVPVIARIVKATLQYLLVDVYGVPGVVEMPSFDLSLLGQHVRDHESINWQLDRICGRKITLNIVEIDRARERLLLKPHIYMFDTDDELKYKTREALSKMQPGDLRQVTVQNLGPLCATVDVDGVEGKIPLYYISRVPVYHTRKVLRLNQKIEAMVLNVDDDGCELSLIHAQMFEVARRRLRPGEVRQGRVVALRAEGVYLDLWPYPRTDRRKILNSVPLPALPDIHDVTTTISKKPRDFAAGDILGLIPVEMAVHGYITHPADLYHRGQEMLVRIDYVTATLMPVVSPLCH
jgi:ribosomal protein S1